MRIAAGVLIILVSLFIDFPAGFIYALAGGVANVAGGGAKVGGLVEAATKPKVDELNKKLADPKLDAKTKAQYKKELDELTKAQAEVTTKGTEVAQKLGSMGMPFGVFLLVLGALAIAAGIVLFVGKAAVFAIIVGFLQLVAEGVGIAVLGFNLFQVPGIIAGIFVIIGALMYPKPQPAR